MQVRMERCPWCGSQISRDEFSRIEARIRAEEKQRVVVGQAELRKRLEAEFAQNVEKAKRATALAARKEAEKRQATLLAERDKALAKAKALDARDATRQEQMRAEIERKVKSSQEQAEKQLQKELVKQREILEKDRAHALLKKQAEFTRERESYQKKIQEMDRRLQRKTANEIGDGAEIDLLEALREAFPDDRVSRIKKGQPGADILHEILHKGEICGSIVYDSKNRQAWQYTFITKLREDQLEAEAEHAVLSTIVFPSGKKELCIESDVVVVNPGRVVYIVRLLRQAMVAMHVRGLSMRERHTKTAMLYRFITSDAYRQRFSQVANLSEDVLELDVQEKKSHDVVWKRRGKLLMQQSNVLREIDTEIAAIVEAADESCIPRAS